VGELLDARNLGSMERSGEIWPATASCSSSVAQLEEEEEEREAEPERG